MEAQLAAPVTVPMTLGFRIRRSGCLFVCTAAALILVTLSLAVGGALMIGSSGSVAFPACQLLVTDSGNVAFDLARNIQFAFSPRITPQIWKNSADNHYTPYQIIENHDPTTASTLFIRDNVTGKVVAFPDIRVAGNMSWSPDNKYFGFEGWSPVRRDTSIFKAFVVVRADGVDRGTVRIRTYTNTYFQWSTDSAYVAGTDGDGVFTVRLADLKVDRRPVQELASIPAWLPHTHYLSWHPTIDSEVIVDVDTRIEHSITFPRMDGRGMQDLWSGDGNFLAIRQTGAQLNEPMRLFAHESNNLREIIPGAITLKSNSKFAQWTPDNQAFVTVQGDQQALIAYYPKEDRYTVLIPDHVVTVDTSPNGRRLLIMRRSDEKVSVIVVFLDSLRVVTFYDDVADVYLQTWATQDDWIAVTLKSGDTYAVELADVATQAHHRLIDGLPGIPDLVVPDEPATSLAFVWDQGGGGLAYYDAKAGTLTRYRVDFSQPDIDFTHYEITISPDNRMAAVGLREGLNWSLQLASPTLPPVLVFRGPTDGPSKMLWSADGQQLFYAFHDGPLALVRTDGSPIQVYSTQFLSTGYGYWAPCNSY